MLAFQDLIAKPTDMGVLFPAVEKFFRVSQPRRVPEEWSSCGTPEEPKASRLNGRIAAEDALVRLPSLRESEWRVTVLQRWVGVVEQVKADQFVAIIQDATNRSNPPELVEMDRAELSKSDIPLLAEGATFYWSIGYRDSPGGQRERIATLRFARRPRLSQASVKKLTEEADRTAALLQSE